MMTMETFKYSIGGKTYVMTPLVLGQMQQLIKLLSDIQIRGFDTIGIIAALGDRLHKALAIILTPEGQSIREKKIDEIAEELAFNMSFDLVIKVVEDFFVCTPIASFFQGVDRVMRKMVETTTSTDSSVSSQEVT